MSTPRHTLAEALVVMAFRLKGRGAAQTPSEARALVVSCLVLQWIVDVTLIVRADLRVLDVRAAQAWLLCSAFTIADTDEVYAAVADRLHVRGEVDAVWHQELAAHAL